MSYKSILLGLVAGDPRIDAQIETAVSLAARSGAHLTALYIVPPFNIPVYAAVPIPTDVADRYYAEEDKTADEVRGAFEAAVAAEGPFASEWHVVHSVPLEAITQNAPFADLVVLGQPGEDRFDPATDALIGDVTMSCGLPVLAVPAVGPAGAPGKSILLAWTPSRETTRAVHDALPLLTAAERVVVLRVDAADDGRDAQIGAYLAHHGVTAEIRDVTASGINVSDAVLNAVSDESCDLIVMGAYGHSRMREYTFGGVTRDIIRQMTAPTLFSH